jgi:hypothetical protein
MGPGERASDRKAVDDDGPVPLFGTWRNAYLAVILTTLVALGGIAAFQAWTF